MGYRAAARGLALALSGAIMAVAWREGLYATLALASLSGGALLIAQWRGAGRSARPTAAAAPPANPATDARERRRLTAYLNLTPAPLVTLAPNGRPQAANRAARALFETADVIGGPAGGREADTGEKLARAIAETPPGRAASVVLTSAAGARSFALVTADVAVEGSASRIAALLDIEGELRAAEASALRDMLLVLGHELRNTLTPIASLSQSAVDMLNDAAPDVPQVRDAVATIARRAAGLQAFSEGYAALARLPPPAFTRTDIRRLTDDLVRLFESRWPDLALKCDSTGAIGSVSIDAGQVSAALWAMLQNSAEALAVHAAGEVRFTTATTADGAQFTISDNGPGVPAENRAAIFQPFFTTKAQGSGIGLALARQIFRAHGGALELTCSSSGGGQAFVGTLPAGR